MQTSARGLAYTTTDMRPPWRKGGLPVVFHHGIGTNHNIWADWLPVIAPHHPALRFDYRGYGASAVPAPDRMPSLSDLVDDLLEMVDATGSPKVHLVGESMGGTLCLAAALRAPERFASVTVTNTAHRGPGINRVMGWRDEFKRMGVKAWSDGMMTARFAPGALSPEQAAWFAATQETSLDYLTVGYGELLAASDLSKDLPSFKPPLLVIMPDGSPFVPPILGAEIKALVPHAELCVLPGVRHGLPFSHAKKCAKMALNLIQRAERAG